MLEPRPRAGLADRVRYEVLRRLGYFVTESSEHFSEYVPWFIKRDRPDLIEEFNIPLDEYIARCEIQIARMGVGTRPRSSSGELDEGYERSQEYGSLIIHSHGNRARRGWSMATSPITV